MIDKELMKNIRRIEMIARKKVNSTFAGEYHSAFKGRGMEFEEVRQYAPGDDIRDIDWNVSARTGDLFIKRFREERELTLYLLVDLSASGIMGSSNKNRMERAAEIAAVLSFSALSNNDRVGLIGFTDRMELYIPPGKGRNHVMDIFSRILKFKPQSKGTDINCALEFLSSVQKRRAIVFLISDFYDQHYSKKLGSLSVKHDFITLCLYDRRERELPSLGLLKLKDPETGKQIYLDSRREKLRQQWSKEHIKRLQQISQLHHRSGADHGELDISGDWMGQLSRFFMKRQARRVY
jgi:uncharacterized protein (DUF58 family)